MSPNKFVFLTLVLFSLPVSAMAKKSISAKKLPEAISSEDILREPLAGPVWFKIPVQKVEFLKNLYMAGVENVFIQTNSEVHRPGIQHFRRQIKSNFKKEFRHIT